MCISVDEMTAKQLENDSQARMMRGMEMLQNGATVKENVDGSFAVPSQTSANVYEVRILGEQMVCTCPDFEYRQIEACKHIHLVKFTLSVRQLNGEPRPKVFAEDALPCDRCGSIRTMKYGKSGGKQTFYCKDCHRKFRESSLLKKARFTPEFVTLCLDLYFSGLSLRKITRTVSTHFNIDVDFSTIYRWIEKYVPMISEYVSTLAPQLSTTWHADELFVKVRGGTHRGKQYGVGFVWNIMDRETRFLIVSKLTVSRDAESTIAAFDEAKAHAHGIKPKTVYTDSLGNYKNGISRNFMAVEHVSNCGIRGVAHTNNNRIERLNSTLRERVKVARGWKTQKTPIAEGQRIAYNFVKPHMALEGKTPAEVAGIKAKGWNELLKLSMNNKS
jgi:transposase-like protein